MIIPMIDRDAVINPIIDAEYQMLIFRNARLSPTPKASMLVAILNIIKLPPFDGSEDL